MIPYEELCEALLRWRQKKGLPVGPVARPAEAPRAAAPLFAPAAAVAPIAVQPTAPPPPPPGAGPWSGSVATDPVPLQDLAAAGQHARASDDHAAVAPPVVASEGKDSTAEIDISDVIDEQDPNL